MNNDIYLQSSAGEVVSLPQGETILGRESVNPIVVNDPAVSRQHLQFKREDQHVWLTDLNSANGTFVNDQRLAPDQLYPLGDGDRISLGGRVNYTIHGTTPVTNTSDTTGTMLLSPEPPASAHQAYGFTSLKPGKVQAIAIMNLVDGILNILWGLGLSCGAVSTLVGVILLPLTVYPIALGIMEIIYASKLMSDPPKVQKPAQYLAIMQIINIITGDVISVVVGILSLVFYSEDEVKAYFNTLDGGI